MIRGILRNVGGYRRLSYDYTLNPYRNSRLAGDYKLSGNYKKAKADKKKDKDKKKKGDETNKSKQEDQPYPFEYDGHIESWIKNTETDDERNRDYKTEMVEIGKGDKGTEWAGWTLSVAVEEKNKTHVLTAPAGSFLHIKDVSDKIDIKLPTSPLENGMVKHDHKVIMPTTLRVSGIVSRVNTQKINEYLDDAKVAKSLGTFFTLISPWKTYDKMYLKSYTSKGSSSRYDVYDYAIDLTEILIATDIKDTTDDAELASNTDKGMISRK